MESLEEFGRRMVAETPEQRAFTKYGNLANKQRLDTLKGKYIAVESARREAVAAEERRRKEEEDNKPFWKKVPVLKEFVEIHVDLAENTFGKAVEKVGDTFGVDTSGLKKLADDIKRGGKKEDLPPINVPDYSGAVTEQVEQQRRQNAELMASARPTMGGGGGVNQTQFQGFQSAEGTTGARPGFNPHQPEFFEQKYTKEFEGFDI